MSGSPVFPWEVGPGGSEVQGCPWAIQDHIFVSLNEEIKVKESQKRMGGGKKARILANHS